jgi:hypothetical protein
LNFAAKVSVLGNSVDLGSIKTTANYVTSSRRWITGEKWPIKDEQLQVSLYRKVEWRIQESMFDSQTLHQNRVFVGVALQYDQGPLLVEVRVEGKPQAASKSFIFPPSNKPAIVISKFTPENDSTCLGDIAKALEDDFDKEESEAGSWLVRKLHL